MHFVYVPCYPIQAQKILIKLKNTDAGIAELLRPNALLCRGNNLSTLIPLDRSINMIGVCCALLFFFFKHKKTKNYTVAVLYKQFLPQSGKSDYFC